MSASRDKNIPTWLFAVRIYFSFLLILGALVMLDQYYPLPLLFWVPPGPSPYICMSSTGQTYVAPHCGAGSPVGRYR